MKNQLRSVFPMLCVAVALGTVAMPAFAQGQGDPPGLAARLSYMSGPVSMQPGGMDDWAGATLNRPLTTSDRLWADQGARAEVSMGNVKARIDQQTSLTIVNLDDRITQLGLDQGSLFAHVRRMFDGESIEIDTPNVAFVVDHEGDYRFDVDPNTDTTYVSVRGGDGVATGEAAGVHVRSGEQVVFSGGNSGRNQMAELGNPDDFDHWNMDRDRRQDNSRSARYVSPGMVGYDDLDDYGAWMDHPEYGPLWRPRVEVGWAPYRVGHWAWIDPWGYTWVDDAPWGFAPFHYGRWVYVGGSWCWAPGRPAVYRPGIPYVRPVYAPALVAFISGRNWGAGIGIGGGGPVGWVPLGYGEPYYPSYHVSENYVRNVNVTNTHITNITNITNNYTIINKTTVINQTVVYKNAQIPGAVTAVPANAIATGRPVNQVAVKVDPKQVQQAKFSLAPPVAPTKEAVLGGNASAQRHVPPPSAVNRPVMAKAPPPPPPVKFEAKQQLLQKNEGRPLAPTEVKNLPTVQRPIPMQAGKPRPPQAVQQIKATALKAGAAAPAIRPPAAKPAAGAPANAAKPGTPPTPSSANKPNLPPAPANKSNTPPNSAPNRPAIPPSGAAAEHNVPRPSSANPSVKPSEPTTPSAKPVPRPPTHVPTPAQPKTATPRPSTAPPAAGHNEPRPQERQATPAATPHNAAPPAKENKPAPKDNKKDNSDEKPK